jgi:hypothetical protein
VECNGAMLGSAIDSSRERKCMLHRRSGTTKKLMCSLKLSIWLNLFRELFSGGSMINYLVSNTRFVAVRAVSTKSPELRADGTFTVYLVDCQGFLRMIA